MVERNLPKVDTRVRFPSPAPFFIMEGRMEDNSPLIEVLEELIHRSAIAQKKFLPGSNQHNLLMNRIYALNIAKALIRNEIYEHKPIYKEELDLAQDPLKSLLSKSEKTIQKLSAGTWQQTILEKNIEALKIVVSLLGRELNRFKH